MVLCLMIKFSYDSGMQVDDSGAATTNPALADRIPTNRDSSGIYYDQVGQAMTIPEVKAYAARHNLTLQQQQQKNKS